MNCTDTPDKTDNVRKESERSSEGIVRVVTKNAFIGVLEKSIQSEGRAQALRQTPLIFEKSGYLQKLGYREGQYVKKGALIAMLQNEQETVAVQENRAALVKAITEFAAKTNDKESALSLLKERYIRPPSELAAGYDALGPPDLDSLAKQILSGRNRAEALMAVSGSSQAHTAYQQSLLNYKRTFFYAPFSGFLGSLSVREGEYVSAGETVAVLYDLSGIRIEVEALEEEAPLITPG